jgi:AcrR family transcriptional regulator
MTTRTLILEKAAELLAQAPDADVSTRAVCDAAGIAAPALYRQFGDKEGLLSAVVDFGFERFLESKRAASARPQADPVDELRVGWDNHVAFAIENPSLYRLMWSPGLTSPPEAAAEGHRMLLGALERCAAAGRLRVSAATAAQMIMAAVTGASLSLIARPELFDDAMFASRLRDAVIAGVTVPADPGRPAEHPADVASAASTLDSRLGASPPASLTAAERTLLHQWLATLADTEAASPEGTPTRLRGEQP